MLYTCSNRAHVRTQPTCWPRQDVNPAHDAAHDQAASVAPLHMSDVAATGVSVRGDVARRSTKAGGGAVTNVGSQVVHDTSPWVRPAAARHRRRLRDRVTTTTITWASKKRTRP